MSSLLLLCATMEGVASFVLPIIDAFGPPKHAEHKFYFEVFQILQFTVSIVALGYLQALISYYDRKMRRHEHRRAKLLEQIQSSNNADAAAEAAKLTDDFDSPSSQKRMFHPTGSHTGSLGFIEEGSPGYASTIGKACYVL